MKTKLKGARKVSDLEEIAARATYPAYSGAFERVRSGIATLVEDNFGFTARKTLAYDDERQQFYFEVDSGRILAVGDTRLLATVNITIDPRKPLVPQLDEAVAQYDEMQKHMRFVYQALKKGVEAGEIKGEVEI